MSKTVYALGSCRINCPLSILDNLEIINLVNNRWRDWLGNFYFLPDQYMVINGLLNKNIVDPIVCHITHRKTKHFRDDWRDVFERLYKKIDMIDCMVIEISSLKDCLGGKEMNIDAAVSWIKRIKERVGRECLWTCHIRPHIVTKSQPKINEREHVLEALIRSGEKFIDPSEFITKQMLGQDFAHYNEYGLSIVANRLRKFLNV